MPTEGPLENSLYLLTQGNAEQMHALYGTLRPTSVDAAIKQIASGVDSVKSQGLAQDFGPGDLNDITYTSIRRVWNFNANANRPAGEGSGILYTVFNEQGTQGIQTWYTFGLTPKVFARFRGSTSWTAWTQTDVSAASAVVAPQMAALEAKVAGADPAKVGAPTWRVQPLPLTAGGTAATHSTTSGGLRHRLRVPVEVARWRVHVRDINPRFGLPQTSNLTVAGVWVGPQGTTPGRWTATPTKVDNGGTATSGAEWVSGWITTPLTADTWHTLGISWSSTAAPQVTRTTAWTTAQADTATPGASTTTTSSPPFDVWLECEVPASMPTVAVISDSLGVGVGSTYGMGDAWPAQLAQTQKWWPILMGHSGDGLNGWTSGTEYKWTARFTGVSKPDAVLLLLGSNNVFGGSSLATLQADAIKVAGFARDRYAQALYLATILPREGVTGAMEDTRRAYNTWLKTLPMDARDVIDIVPAVSADDETLIDAYDADGIHLNTAGYAAIAASITRPLAPKIVDSKATQDAAAAAIASATSAGNAETSAATSATAAQQAAARAEAAEAAKYATQDEGTATLVGNNSSLTKTALDLHRKNADTRVSNPVNVKDYGAKGNGSADDTAAIDDAQAVANASYGRPLYFPNGTYNYGGAGLTVKSIVGQNRQKTWIRYTGTGSAVTPIPDTINYHRSITDLTISGAGAGTSAIGLDLDNTPSGHFANLIISGFTTGISLTSVSGLSSALYNVFDDVTVQSCTTGVYLDGIANENRFDKFRINQCPTGFDFTVAGRNVISSSAIENCTTGVRVRGHALNKANVFQATRFEFCTTTYQTDAGSEMSAFVACRFIGGVKVDNGALTVDIDLATATYRGRGAAFTNSDSTRTTPTITIANLGSGDAIQADGSFAVTKAGHVKTTQFYNPASFANARVQLNTSGTIVDRNVGDNATTLRVNQVHASATGNVQEWQTQSVTKARITRNGHHVISTTTAPADGDIVAGEIAFWFDSTNGAAKLMVKAKQADGTVRTGSVPLT